MGRIVIIFRDKLNDSEVEISGCESYRDAELMVKSLRIMHPHATLITYVTRD